MEGDQETRALPEAVSPEPRLADAAEPRVAPADGAGPQRAPAHSPHGAGAAALEAALAAAPPEPSNRNMGRFLVVAFLVIILALVLIAATGDPYGAGCGGG